MIRLLLNTTGSTPLYVVTIVGCSGYRAMRAGIPAVFPVSEVDTWLRVASEHGYSFEYVDEA